MGGGARVSRALAAAEVLAGASGRHRRLIGLGLKLGIGRTDWVVVVAVGAVVVVVVVVAVDFLGGLLRAGEEDDQDDDTGDDGDDDGVAYLLAALLRLGLLARRISLAARWRALFRWARPETLSASEGVV